MTEWISPGHPEWEDIVRRVRPLQSASLMFLRTTTMGGYLWDALWVSRSCNLPYLIGGYQEDFSVGFIQWANTWESAVDLFTENPSE